jgi:transcriptional regulator with XRE-family HTH domain
MSRSDPVTADEFRQILDSLGWSQRELADRIGRSESRIRKYARDRDFIDAPLAGWLRAIESAYRRGDERECVRMLDHPPPAPRSGGVLEPRKARA